MSDIAAPDPCDTPTPESGSGVQRNIHITFCELRKAPFHPAHVQVRWSLLQETRETTWKSSEPFFDVVSGNVSKVVWNEEVSLYNKVLDKVDCTLKFEVYEIEDGSDSPFPICEPTRVDISTLLEKSHGHCSIPVALTLYPRPVSATLILKSAVEVVDAARHAKEISVEELRSMLARGLSQIHTVKITALPDDVYTLPNDAIPVLSIDYDPFSTTDYREKQVEVNEAFAQMVTAALPKNAIVKHINDQARTVFISSACKKGVASAELDVEKIINAVKTCGELLNCRSDVVEIVDALKLKASIEKANKLLKEQETNAGWFGNLVEKGLRFNINTNELEVK